MWIISGGGGGIRVVTEDIANCLYLIPIQLKSPNSKYLLQLLITGPVGDCGLERVYAQWYL